MQSDSVLLATTESDSFVLKGPVTFDNAAQVAAVGGATLSQALAERPQAHWSISLAQMELADSSALSVFLSWMRLAQSEGISLCFTAIPAQLAALAKVSDVYGLIQQEASCGRRS